MMKQRVGVLMGGWGEERDISLKTGEGIRRALGALGHEVVPLDAGPGLDRALREARLDVAFLALHGRLGEDGAVQGLLEVMGIPYTGSGILASALAMNKPFAKKLFTLHNIPCPRGYSLKASQLGALEQLHGDLGFPVVVKPARGGSSVGVSVVRAAGELSGAVEKALAFGGEAMVERKAEGREVTVALLEERVLGSCEIAFAAESFDHPSKYQGGSEYFLPARLSPTRQRNIGALARLAFQALGCRGYARVDLICGERDNDVVLELNTLPGMTPRSLFPKIAAHAGLEFPGLVQALLDRATLDSREGRDAEPRALGGTALRVVG